MAGFEDAFAEAQRQATAAATEAQRLTKAAKALQRAASDGDVNAWHKAAVGLKSAIDAARQATDNATAAWRFSEEEEISYLANGYAAELLALAVQAGLQMRQDDSRLFVYPAVLQIQPWERSVVINRHAVRAIRPSRIIAQLKASQTKPSKFKGPIFLTALHEAYRTLTDGHMMSSDTVLLANVFRIFTIAPDSEYTRDEFARDLYLLSSNGPYETKSHHRVSFPASTGTRANANRLFQTVDERGETVVFYGLRFVEVPQ